MDGSSSNSLSYYGMRKEVFGELNLKRFQPLKSRETRGANAKGTEKEVGTEGRDRRETSRARCPPG